MTFLPIVDRELRAAARRKSTFRLRLWATLLGVVLSFFSLFYAQMMRFRGVVGNPAFDLFTAYAFGLALLAGIFLTGDCVSEEKREGTLGLLFLTDLKGYDVVLGKFTARSLNAFFCLLALLPLAGVPVLLGGVTGGEFWRVALALLNTLFFSLAAGMLISTVSRHSQRAMGGTLALVLFFSAGLPALLAFGVRLHLPLPAAPLARLSPYYAYAYGMEPGYWMHRGDYWWGLAASHLLGWSFLGVAAWTLPHAWQDRDVGVRRAASSAWERWRRWGLGTPQSRARRRAADLEVNPVLWLAGCNRAVSRSLWIVVILWGLVALGLGLAPAAGRGGMPPIIWIGMFFAFVIKALLAVQSCRFFSEIRRDGMLEALLNTPLTSHKIIGGQSAAFQQVMLGPVATFIGLLYAPGLLRAAWTAASGAGTGWEAVLGSWAFGGGLTLTLLLDLLAIRWFGMWLSLKMNNPTYATGLTILFVVILPSAACSVCCPLSVPVDLVLFLVGYTQCQEDLRRAYARQYNTPGAAR